MANLPNYYAESGAGLIGDDAEPTFELSNTSTGPGLKVDGAVFSAATIIALEGNPTISGGNASLAPFSISPAAVASAPAIDLNAAAAVGGFISCTSIVLTTVANTDYAMRVRVGSDTFRWLPLFKDAAIVGGAAYA